MKKWIIIIFSVVQLLLLAGCSEKSFVPIAKEKAFIASLNILQPSLDFINQKGEVFASWQFEKGYTGAILIDHQHVLLYGNQLEKADMYALDTGKLILQFKTGVGVTNAYYAEAHDTIFMTNSKTNTITSFDKNGLQIATQKLGNYPMSMEANGDKLYVVNYKDTDLSVLDVDSLKVEEQWPIDKSSNGIAIIEERNELWLGGHGEGSKPNANVKRLDLSTGEQIGVIDTPLMPVGLTKAKDEVLVVSHGQNELYVADFNG
ncbi:MAG: YncE family protein, partial [Lysinibacillus sp.]